MELLINTTDKAAKPKNSKIPTRKPSRCGTFQCFFIQSAIVLSTIDRNNAITNGISTALAYTKIQVMAVPAKISRQALLIGA